MKASESGGRYGLSLTVGALGVVYGDIGTSPLYALRECFHGPHAIAATSDNILGVLSLIFWSLLIIVSLKYLTVVMRANNKGEGGILALLSLAFPERGSGEKYRMLWIGLGVFGAALLYGDGAITPVITVLGAIEGLEVATPAFKPYIIPLTIAILVGLFSFQHIGTGKVGKIFGPVMVIWFLSLAALGIKGIIQAPAICSALNPLFGLQFLLANGGAAFIVLGAVFLVVTGAEALYADMGHFGIRPIRRAWFLLVLPALVLNYLGQGALLLTNPAAASNPFYLLAPAPVLYPLVILATMAGVIASQALISGAFSLTMQGIQLGYIPRMDIRHTSSDERGQIYLPQVNWALMVVCIGLTVGFGSSSRLAAAYGIAVTLTMVITTILFYFAARRMWNWSQTKAGLLCAAFLIPEMAFCGANFTKFSHGGWFPIVMGIVIFILMSTWKTGRRLLRERLQLSVVPYNEFLENILKRPPVRVKGTAVFLAADSKGTPVALLHNLKHNKVLHERVILLTLITDEVSHVDAAERVEIERLHEGFYRIIGHYGFMDEPNVPEVLERCSKQGLEIVPADTTYFLSRETIIATDHPGMALWRERLFSLMSRNAERATTFFHLPANRVVEMGMRVEL